MDDMLEFIPNAETIPTCNSFGKNVRVQKRVRSQAMKDFREPTRTSYFLALKLDCKLSEIPYGPGPKSNAGWCREVTQAIESDIDIGGHGGMIYQMSWVCIRRASPPGPRLRAQSAVASGDTRHDSCLLSPGFTYLPRVDAYSRDDNHTRPAEGRTERHIPLLSYHSKASIQQNHLRLTTHIRTRKMVNAPEKYLAAKRSLGFLHASSSYFSNSLGTFFSEIDAILSDSIRNDPWAIRMDPNLMAGIRRITQNHSPRLWSRDLETRRRILVKVRDYEEYPEELYCTFPLMIDVVVGYLLGRRNQYRHKQKKTAKFADCVREQEAQESGEGQDEQGEDEDAKEVRRGTSSYKIDGNRDYIDDIGMVDGHSWEHRKYIHHSLCPASQPRSLLTSLLPSSRYWEVATCHAATTIQHAIDLAHFSPPSTNIAAHPIAKCSNITTSLPNAPFLQFQRETMNSRSMLTVQHMLGFRPAENMKNSDLRSHPTWQNLLQDIAPIEQGYSHMTNQQLENSTDLTIEVRLLADIYGPIIWSDDLEDRDDLLTRAHENSHGGLYPRDLYWSDPLHQEMLD
ncbi:uncharacterized protein MYCFIDRAFT_180520 [Pseudocercospora fijiensis CIRAD86]|uniref:Uncharacterized protein n=1 Tax=Pseudocercospora fijiensis (strain CIRAD86) TaxID=383855 RepID=M2ZCL8_PSEFD|nr:uncharacterized protein MYCFIDRAFT_180520 [Pseudocercospora fijiensis CIRAD86]EME76854.1 hypothetical protein MYCFIDRAFT_180520 [Pseudocercospora fijiensis CIRAD86]